MKTHYWLMFFIFSSCITQKHVNINHHQVEVPKFKIQEIDDTKIGNKIPIYFILYNANTFPVFLNDPSCWNSSLPTLHFEGESLVIMIKVKVNPACAEHLIKINEKDSVVVEYNFPLDFIFNLKATGVYTLQFSYYGNLYSENRRKVKEVELHTNKILFNIQN